MALTESLVVMALTVVQASMVAMAEVVSMRKAPMAEMALMALVDPVDPVALWGPWDLPVETDVMASSQRIAFK